MKKKYIIILFFVIIISMIMGFSFIKSVNAIPSDVNYTIGKDELYNNPTIDREGSYNIRAPFSYGELYHGTYSFTNEADGTTGTNVDFIDVYTASTNTIAGISNNKEGHSKVLNITDNNNADRIDIEHTLASTQTSGTIQYWHLSTDPTFSLAVRFFDDTTTNAILVKMDEDDYQYYNGGWNKLIDVSINTWYHIEIEFECGAGGYKGLAPDTYYIYINRIQYGAFAFRNPVSLIEYISFLTVNSDDNYINYFDAFAFSWDGAYAETMNHMPFRETPPSYDVFESKQYEWLLKEPNVKWNGESSPFSWTSKTIGTGSATVSNGQADIHCTGANSQYGFFRQQIGTSCTFINITYHFYIADMDDTNAYLEFRAESPTPMKELYQIRAYQDQDLEQYDGTSWNVLYNDIDLSKDYNMEVFVNLEMDLVSVVLHENLILIDTYLFPTIEVGGTGLDYVNIIGDQTVGGGNEIVAKCEYLSIICDGVSLSEEYSYTTLDMDIAGTYNIKNHNILDLQQKGNLTLGACESTYTIGESSYINIIDTQVHNDTLAKKNTYGNYVKDVVNPTLVFFFYGSHQFNLTSINIHGAKLTEGSNTYYLNYTYGNVNPDKSYFYPDNNNKLHWIHISNDNNLEYIQASFNINDESTDDRAIVYTTYKEAGALGYFVVNFTTSTTNIFELSSFLRTTRAVLTQNKSISTFYILLTDNDDNSISGTTEGYITDISLLFTENIIASITTLTLVGMMIPLIIILVPTYAIANIYGKKLIIPLFLALSLVCTITTLIPVWLFFIIALSSSILLLKSRAEVNI